MTVRTRFAPSPTGFLHIGGLRTAAYAYALAKHSSGQFLLRIEDTDQKRIVEGSKEKIFEVLEKFGLMWDETPIVQSERVKTGVYKEAAQKLIKDGRAFYCFCKPKGKDISYDKSINRDPCRNLSGDEVKKKLESGAAGAIKLKIPDNEKISFRDFVFKKEISWDSNSVPDTILLKSDGFPTYHLAVVVDDTSSQITHVLRGYDWMPSTPIHLLVYKFLGLNIPEIGHLTDIQDPSGGKLSKRKGNVSVEQFIADGYLPEALFNFIILLGWAPKDNRELFTLADFVQFFDSNGFQKANPTFNPQKLDWFNEHYIRSMDNKELVIKTKPFSTRSEEEILRALPLVKDRMTTLKDFDLLSEYFFTTPEVDQKLFDKYLDTKVILDNAIGTLEKDFDGKILEENARVFCQTNGVKVGDYFMVLRLAITGRGQTPPLWDVMQIIGKDETLKRLRICLPIEQKQD